MGRPKVGVVIVAQNDAETIERSVASYYDHVDAILLSTDPNRGWTGVPITPDDTVERVKRLDTGDKLTVVTGDYYTTPEPSRNDTLQRQDAVNHLARVRPELDWVLQIDADEVFPHFSYLIDQLAQLPRRTKSIAWWWVNVFQRTADGRLLVVTDYDGRPLAEFFPVGHRPVAQLESCRFTQHRVKSPLLRRLLKLSYLPRLDRGTFGPRQAALHLSFAKSEGRIREKLATYTHAQQIDQKHLLDTWLSAPTDWKKIRNFHPISPKRWPALRPFAESELLNYAGPWGQRPAG